MSTIEIRMPRIGHSMEEGTVVAWLAAPGATVAAGDPIASVETDKTTFEVEAPAAGALGGPLVAEGETVPVGALLATIGTADEARTAAAAPADSAPAEHAAAPAPPPERARGDRAPVSPKARRLAEARGIDPAGVTGSGPDGLVTAEDVAAAAAGGAPAEEDRERRWRGRLVAERRALSVRERAAARRTQSAWAEAPHFVQMIDVDMTAAKTFRERWKRDGGALAAVTVGDLCVAATAHALAGHPAQNAAIDGDERVRFAEIGIGIAVDTPHGLVVPVIARADTLDLAALAARGRALAAAAREDRLRPQDLEGGSATVSNLGAFGIRAGTPVLNSPEAMLVFVGALEDRVVALDGEAVVQPQMTLSVAYDHRVVDGAAAARLTTRIRDLLQTPQRLLEAAGA